MHLRVWPAQLGCRGSDEQAGGVLLCSIASRCMFAAFDEARSILTCAASQRSLAGSHHAFDVGTSVRSGPSRGESQTLRVAVARETEQYP